MGKIYRAEGTQCRHASFWSFGAAERSVEIFWVHCGHRRGGSTRGDVCEMRSQSNRRDVACYVSCLSPSRDVASYVSTIRVKWKFVGGHHATNWNTGKFEGY